MKESRRFREGARGAGTQSGGSKGAMKPPSVASGGEPQRFAQSLPDRLLALLGADGEALGEHELRLDADEVERGPEVALDELVAGRRRTLAVDAATGQRDDHASAAGQALRTILGVLEGLTGNRDAVEPRLELRWNAEI